MIRPNSTYYWEIETVDNVIRKQYDEKGIEQTWKDLPLDKIIRVSFIPVVQILPRHDFFIDIVKGERFLRRFGRAFMKQTSEGTVLAEYINCIVTNKYRAWVFSTGRVVLTHVDFELYL